MRAEDQAEVLAFHDSVLDAARLSFGLSEWSRVVVDEDGELVCAYGVGRHSLLEIDGYPWMLSTNRIVRHARAFARGSREVVRFMRERHPVLVNYVHAPYRSAVAWLRWLGADVAEEVTMIRGQPFYRFEWIARDV